MNKRESRHGRVGQWVLDLLFPPKCPFCTRVLDKPRSPVCPQCQGQLPWLTGERADRRVEFADHCLSPLAYRGAVVESVHRYKFPGNPSYADAYGLLLAQCVRDHLDEPFDLVTWAPLSKKRRKKRGFDQGQLLAWAVARELDVPLKGTLVKTRHTPPQSGLDQAGERRANVLGAYCLAEGTQLAGLRVLLVDDVVTSGATLGECARLLKQAGAAQVCCAALAQARDK